MTLEFPAVKLSLYAQIVGYAECAFWGINAPGNANYACRNIWTLPERMMLERALLEAQEELENVLHYPLSARWFTGERHNNSFRYVTTWGKLIEPGILADTMIEAGASVSYAAEPALITVDLGTCSLDNVHVFLPGTDIEVEISSIVPTPGSVVMGTYDIAIPRCRLVDEGYRDNPPEGYDYGDVATWGTPTVDVRCLATDPSTQAVIITRNRCDNPPCSDTRTDGCEYISNYDLGFLDVTPGTYSNGVWTRSCTLCCPSYVDLNYKAGLTSLTRQQGDTIIRLAHSKMPTEPCGCDVTQRLWKRDRNVPEILDAARLECPFGMSDGAWIAWKFANTFALVRGSTLFGKRSINA